KPSAIEGTRPRVRGPGDSYKRGRLPSSTHLQHEQVEGHRDQTGDASRADDSTSRFAAVSNQAKDERCHQTSEHATADIGPAQPYDGRVDVEIRHRPGGIQSQVPQGKA